MRLSILDATPIGPGVPASQALQWTTEVALLAEQLCYYRLWVVEHHCVSDIGCSTPAVMIAHLAAMTKRIRIGAGGVMLPNHPPLIVAEQFSMLQGLYPGRIDLGIGRAAGTDSRTAHELRRVSSGKKEFLEQLDKLTTYLNYGFSKNHSRDSRKISLLVDSPPIYILGSSASSARFAADFGMPFAFAMHLNPKDAISAIKTYKKKFQSHGSQKTPYVIVTVAVVCAPSRKEAEHSAFNACVIRLRRSLAHEHGIQINDDVLLYPKWSNEELKLVRKKLSEDWILIGSPDQIVKGLEKFQQTTGADELMLTTIEYNGPDRFQTFKMIANAFNLAG